MTHFWIWLAGAIVVYLVAKISKDGHLSVWEDIFLMWMFIVLSWAAVLLIAGMKLFEHITMRYNLGQPPRWIQRLF